ncbi:uncharacterized protein [Littorina saxatilis]|uniref:uncharacterized protein n=1 Tax=Littorina saxatilis TaxID=31220 RepID=UPI0038B5BAA9
MNNDSDVRYSLAMSQQSSEDIDNISTNSGREDTSSDDDEADNDDTSTILTDATITNPTTNNFIIYNDAEINIAGIPRMNTYSDNREAVPHQTRGQDHRSSVNLARSGCESKTSILINCSDNYNLYQELSALDFF